jgi:hypothetical protein
MLSQTRTIELPRTHEYYEVTWLSIALGGGGYYG